MQNELTLLKIKENISHQMVLAVDEACANSIIHQHNCDGKSHIKLRVYVSGKSLHIEIQDVGVPFPNRSIPAKRRS